MISKNKVVCSILIAALSFAGISANVSAQELADGTTEEAVDISNSEDSEEAELSDEDLLITDTDEANTEEKNLESDSDFEVLSRHYGANNTFSTATPISVNQEVTDNTTTSSDVNYYKFTTTSAGYISISFRHEYVDGDSKRWSLSLINSDESSSYWSTAYYGNVQSTVTNTSCNIGLPAGTYYIKIETNGYYNWSNVNYYFTVNYTQTDTWETEFNGKFSTADTIAVNSKVTGTSRTSDDNDYYVFSTTSPGYISISFSHEYVDGNSKRWSLSLINSDESSSYWSTAYYGNVQSTVTNTSCNIGLPAGTYYIKIETNGYYNWSDVNYYFTVNYTQTDACETEFNGKFSAADDLQSNTTMLGTCKDSNDSDIYKFTVEKAGYVTFNFLHEYVEGNSKRWTLSCDDSSENELWNENFYGNDASGWSDYGWYESGTYYIKIETNGYYNWSDVNYYLTVNYYDGRDIPGQTMYRLYNPNSGEHFYTGNLDEKDYLASIGWNYEGEAWTAPQQSNSPVYRLYNPNSGDHHYTPNASERDMLVSIGWNDEGIGWYSNDYGWTDLYRLYNPNCTGAGSHHYTTSWDEARYLSKVGWNYEGIGWYGL